MAAARTSAALEIRKFRKKMRQIENLERLERDWTEEEYEKVIKKSQIREKLLELLASQNEEFDESFASTTRSSDISSQVDTDLETDTSASVALEEISFSADITADHEVTIVSKEDTDKDIDIETVDNQDGFIQVTKSKKSKSHSESPQKEDNTTIEEDVSPKKKKKTEKDATAGRKATSPAIKDTKLKSVVQQWRNCQLSVYDLEGHHDLVTDVSAHGGLFVSASRDTTLKLWDLETLSVKRSYGGHTSSVTSVILLSKEDSSKIAQLLGTEEEEQLIISGSLDCSYKIWSVTSGQSLKSTYTYSPVTKIAYHPVAEVIITGSDGGKIEVWDVEKGESIHSVCCYNSAVTALKIDGDHIFACSSEGEIKVFTWKDKQWSCLFVSEHLQTSNNGQLTQRCIRGAGVAMDTLYYGDDGVNIKVLKWGKALVSKLKNHNDDFGITDSICCYDNVLLSSAYNLDTGSGYMNVRYLLDGNYISTIDDEETDRIIAVTCTKFSKDQIAIVSGGIQLKVWLLNPENGNPDLGNIIHSKFITKLAGTAKDSDDESDADFSEDEEVEDRGRRGRSSPDTDLKNSGWLSWCNII